jgi:flagellar motor switch protein FliG
MIANANDSLALKIDAMSGIQKAAVLLVMLGDTTSAELIKQLSEDDIQLVSREIARLNAISTEQAESVLNEFYQMTAARNYVVRGGLEYAKNMLINAFGPEAAQRLMDRLSKALGHDMANFDALQKADPQQLAKFLHAEHPQTIALVLSHLNPSQAAALLAALPQEQRADIALRVAHLDQISPDVINKIATVIGQKLDALGDYSRQSYGGVRAVAEMFNRLDSDTSKKVLGDIEAKDPNLVETIRHMMFVFDDLLLLDDNAIKAILARVDRKVPMIALKGTTDRLKNHFLQTMSERGAQMMREDIEALGPVKVKDVEVAQQEIIAVLRLLESEGVVSLRGAVGEQYVV